MSAQGRGQTLRTYQRGEDSRQRLIDAGLDVFGLYGFDGASTRMLAEKAKVNLAAIPYYFGGKEGLYRAVAEHVARQIADSQAPVVGKVAAAMNEPNLSAASALSLLHEIIDSFAATVIGSGEADRWARLVMREQMDPTPAFDILYDGVMSHVHGVCSALIARILGQSEDDPDTLIRTSTIIGQFFVFRTSRSAILRRLGWETFTDERIGAIQAIIREQTAAMLLDARAQRP